MCKSPWQKGNSVLASHPDGQEASIPGAKGTLLWRVSLTERKLFCGESLILRKLTSLPDGKKLCSSESLLEINLSLGSPLEGVSALTSLPF
jgi:hypothetical protein